MANSGTSSLSIPTLQSGDSGQLIVDFDPGFYTLTPEEKQAIADTSSVRIYKKGALLLKPGQVANYCYFVFKGCVREYYLIDGEEKTTAFYTEGDSISSNSSFIQRVPAKHYWECIEECTLSSTSYEGELELFRRCPRFGTLCREKVEEKLGEYQEKLAAYMLSTPEERYLDILSNRPDLLYRVPQYQLASYIGVKPESLSRIRRRISNSPITAGKSKSPLQMS